MFAVLPFSSWKSNLPTDMGGSSFIKFVIFQETPPFGGCDIHNLPNHCSNPVGWKTDLEVTLVRGTQDWNPAPWDQSLGFALRSCWEAVSVVPEGRFVMTTTMLASALPAVITHKWGALQFCNCQYLGMMEVP